MKYKYFLTMVLATLSLYMAPSYAQQGSGDAACDIWICLPHGFATSHCNPAKSEFLDRIKHFKPPLVPFSQCIKGSSQVGGSVMTARQGRAYWVPPKKCGFWNQNTGSGHGSNIPGGSGDNYGPCIEHNGYWSLDAQSCGGGPFCQTKRYIQIQMDGKDEGSPYYY